jgi:hypothetical protein
VPGQNFAEGIGALIAFIETNPMIPIKELPVKLLGINPPAGLSAPPLTVPAPPVPAETLPSVEPAPSAAPVEPAARTAPVEPPLAPEQQEKLKRLTMDLRWLVQEGYVTEFADGRLFTPPPIAEARAKAAESGEGEEHDQEAFPEIPISPDTPAPATPPADVANPSPEAEMATEPPAPPPMDPDEAPPPLDPDEALPPLNPDEAPPPAGGGTNDPA